ncbi:Sulfatase [Halomonas sp. THAF5a]|uniref:LTA synthase family protein n=1 Tax=Halomonas sp. THAF5a TaxID=2587844 RepID=UPI001268D367|nr:LTA synthase family protein [Halomonas sp. THAF5a]QFU01712.1 Sulfatase [Halomonas sp. THAF5a]
MTSDLWWPWLCGLGLTLGLEALLRPAVARFWRRPLATHLVHLGTWSLVYALFVLVLQRPWFAMAFIAALLLVVVQSSNTKWQTLREPFIYQDFEYFLDAIRHPRLYVPFFGIGLALGAITAGALAIGGFLLLEPSLLTGDRPVHAFIALLVSLPLAALLIMLGLRRLPSCILVPQQDLHRLGLFSALWAYGRLASQPLAAPTGDAFPPAQPTRRAQQDLPHVVAVQSESFFDPRDWCPALEHGVLAEYDEMVLEAVAHGPLRVPAWGANTVRTEAAFLTGLDQVALGIHRFNPYHPLTRQGVPSLASRLRGLGYRTVCVHPYPAGFYARDRVMPRLGFDDFIDIRAFDETERCGQYVGDVAVADKVGKLLTDQDNRPLFVFAITMENHGPLDLDPLDPGPPEAWFTPGVTIPSGECGELLNYLAHLRNADRMTRRLRQALRDAPREGLLCWYGDHVPIMPRAYHRFGLPDGSTTYTLWSTWQRQGAASDHAPLYANQLGQRLWQAVLEGRPGAQDQEVTTSHHQEQA